ncbi:hypothetical protein [Streptomyces sp. NPDC096132]|uniref:hypothetical protein n=1 Tax=Streptomyces sp. NPDC096132 TaxID=3366075 RepID=UPI0038117E74
MMRDLIAAFGTAARERMTDAGWRKHTSDIYTLDLGGGFHAWVGLNRASKHHPLMVNPVVGLRYDPLERLVEDLLGTRLGMAATIARPVGCLTSRHSLLQLRVATDDDARPAAEELRHLVQTHGLPFARRHASPAALMTALREGGNVPNPDRARLLVPALHALQGEAEPARASLARGLAHYGDDTTSPITAGYHQFAAALTALLDEQARP